MLEEAEAPALLPALPVDRQPGDSVALLVGPEGGWTDRERALIAGSNWRPVSLGPEILRTETAALAALAVVNAAWGAF
jgi:16S rRNA (uracil1498-N3)-methyltransferase